MESQTLTTKIPTHPFDRILDTYRQNAISQRDKGDRFELLIKRYLKTDPKYADILKEVWLWNEFPHKNDFGGKDTGIDLVAQTTDGDYWAIQCKCYQEDTTIDKSSVDSFLSTSGKQFTDENGQKIHFAHRLWVSTSVKWGNNALETIKNQNPPVSQLHLYDLRDAPVDWEKLDSEKYGPEARTGKKNLMEHQTEAIEAAQKHFQKHDRGKLIMACGTGKTFTSLKLAENQTTGQGLILFLVPSIALLGQTLNEWCAQAAQPLDAICICSDSKVRKKDSDADNTAPEDLPLPATTDVEKVLNRFQQWEKRKNDKRLRVIFSTYQSIDVISKVQEKLRENNSPFAEFDLIICDEAHRTTGVSYTGQDDSAFIKVHNNDFIRSKKRLYMTATPRLYKISDKDKATQNEAFLCSMDDENLYGHEFYHIGFGKAVEKNLLTDYKVLVLTLHEQVVPPKVQESLATETEIETDDPAKIIGCINALSKKILGDEGTIQTTDPNPMRRSVAFCQKISVSKEISKAFDITSEKYSESLPEDHKDMLRIESKHVDGGMNAELRNNLLNWLKEEPEEGTCRILTNVRCLSEGVDVPSLDAVMFLSARNSEIDVVQSVGRVMRKSPGKKYGYIIIPIVIPSDVDPKDALNDNKRFAVVWTVLNALRAHDDRFEATVNKIDLNKAKPGNILIGTSAISYDENGEAHTVNENNKKYNTQDLQGRLALGFDELKLAVYAKLVQKVGDRSYWENWAKEVGQIAKRQKERIHKLITEKPEHTRAFGNFLSGLHKNINPSINIDDAIEMLSQHIITKPVFDALFEGYSFVQNNPMSRAMQGMLDLLEGESLERDVEVLQSFYESVRRKAAGIDNAEGKQRIIIELYDKFFQTAFPKMVEQLGIVYTPVEVVDFILHSVDDILKQEFCRGLTDEGVHILDPFTGTGTFITRLLQSGLITEKDLERKYKHELHANEIVLLAYYIAAINIENAYHDATPDPDDGIGTANYHSFDGIVLTDTFQLGETPEGEKLFSEMFPQNSERVERQKKAPIRVIIGNPPYSVGQKSANDNAQNQSYPKLEKRIANTYAKGSSATSLKSLYDSYIKAFRWCTDRLDKNGGMIAFVSNGGWLDTIGMDSFRKTIEKEFTEIYVFNLRGNQRTSGELSRKEGGKIFGSGSRTPVTITVLVKNPAKQTDKARIYYHDIGDYLSREEKLRMIRQLGTFQNPMLNLITLQSDEHGDWINQRSKGFEEYIPIQAEKKFDESAESFFITHSLGTASNRDAWVYNFSKQSLQQNIRKTIAHYSEELEAIVSGIKSEPTIDSTKGSWPHSWLDKLSRKKSIAENPNEYRMSLYRPFAKQHNYFDNDLIHRRHQLPKFFPTPSHSNVVICVHGLGGSKEYSCLISDCIPDLNMLEAGAQCFPLYYYEKEVAQMEMFGSEGERSEKYVRKEAVTDYILKQAQNQYGNEEIHKEDIFYFVYGFLHNPQYRIEFASDLKKMLPRIPLPDSREGFWKYSKLGRELADLHINYEKVEPHPDVIVVGDGGSDNGGADSGDYRVTKMRFPKKDQKDTIIYNHRIIIQNIPAKAYEYIVNGKSAIEWIMERYQITTHKESLITNDPNDWAGEHNNPRYILDLLLSIINVSVQTVDIVHALPAVDFGESETR